MIKEFVNHVQVTFPTLKEANEAIAFMRAKLEVSIGHWVSVYDLIRRCSLTPDFAYRFTCGELNDWGWTSIDGFSLKKGPHRSTYILTMPPTRKRGMINLKDPFTRGKFMDLPPRPITPPPEFKELYINVPRGCGKTMTAMKIIEDICENTKLRKEINNKITHYCEPNFYGYEHILEYQHLPSEKRYRLEYMVPFDSTCFLESWPDEKVEMYLNKQENKARKELIDRVINDINKGDVETMPYKNFDTSLLYENFVVKAPDIMVKSPKIAKIETYNERVVKVTFADGTFTKAVCSENDIFDIDVGITICVIKKMLGKNGNKTYNDMIRDAHKLMDKQENEKIAEKMRKEEIKKKNKLRQMKKQAKKLKIKEEQIDITKQGFIRAMQETGMVNDGR